LSCNIFDSELCHGCRLKFGNILIKLHITSHVNSFLFHTFHFPSIVHFQLISLLLLLLSFVVNLYKFSITN